jgi:hypothetical protein
MKGGLSVSWRWTPRGKTVGKVYSLSGLAVKATEHAGRLSFWVLMVRSM